MLKIWTERTERWFKNLKKPERRFFAKATKGMNAFETFQLKDYHLWNEYEKVQANCEKPNLLDEENTEYLGLVKKEISILCEW
jgi:hypothetical protein